MSIGGTAAYESERDLPPLVTRAVALAQSMEFEYSCLPAQGRFLQLLAAARRGGRIGESGTGCGVGLAWMASAVDGFTKIISAEIDPTRADAAAELFHEIRNVTVLSSSWKALEEHGPFDLLVLDGGGTGKSAETDPERADPARCLVRGGTLVIDDFTPSTEWPRKVGGNVDAARMAWLQHPNLLSTEVPITAKMSVVLAVRL